MRRTNGQARVRPGTGSGTAPEGSRLETDGVKANMPQRTGTRKGVGRASIGAIGQGTGDRGMRGDAEVRSLRTAAPSPALPPKQPGGRVTRGRVLARGERARAAPEPHRTRGTYALTHLFLWAPGTGHLGLAQPVIVGSTMTFTPSPRQFGGRPGEGGPPRHAPAPAGRRRVHIPPAVPCTLYPVPCPLSPVSSYASERPDPSRAHGCTRLS
jgi:hypothetical protein